MAFEIKSPVFKDNETIPTKYTCEGENISPPLKWNDPPKTTKSFAIINDDPDAPMGTWIHWVIYDIPADLTSLSEAVPTHATLPNGAKQGVNDFRRIGYGGPYPPPGKAHRYFFKLYALDIMVNGRSGITKTELLRAMKGHVLAESALIGLYKR